MKVGAIGRSYGGFYNVHNIPDISQIDAEKVLKQDASKIQQVEKETDSGAEAVAERKPVAKQELEDISVRFNKNDTYGYIGKDSDINKLDIERAVSEMRKDQVLEQYQYFVGTAEQDKVLFESADGVVVRK